MVYRNFSIAGGDSTAVIPGAGDVPNPPSWGSSMLFLRDAGTMSPVGAPAGAFVNFGDTATVTLPSSGFVTHTILCPTWALFAAAVADAKAGATLTANPSGPIQVKVVHMVGGTSLTSIDTNFTGHVHMALAVIPSGTVGPTLSGTTTVIPVKGIASFSDLSINYGGSGYALATWTDADATEAGSAPCGDWTTGWSYGCVTSTFFTIFP